MRLQVVLACALARTALAAAASMAQRFAVARSETSVSTIAQLLHEGGDPNSVDVRGNSVLLQVAAECNAMAVRFLLDAGVDDSLQNDLGLTAADVWKRNDCGDYLM
jgi:ankyrin repeat protein